MDGSSTSRLPSGIVDGDSIRVRLRTGCDADRVWLAMRDPARLSLWFGDLDRPWQRGGVGRVDFGDGDFFDVVTRDVVEGRLIDFDWSFLGLAPTARIRWTLTSLPDGTEITVADHQADRTPAEVDELVAGWTDFWERLGRFLDTGHTSRYGQRDEIDGGVVLPCDAAPLNPCTIHRWLPVASDGLNLRWFFVIDEDGPRRFRLTDWQAGPDQVTFSVEIPGADRPTSCSLRVEPVAQRQRLSFSQTGWGRLGLSDSRVRLLRRRFTTTWVEALERARELAGSRRPHRVEEDHHGS
jgi:uncharacterized protein YndB with AHSA1/START domain